MIDRIRAYFTRAHRCIDSHTNNSFYVYDQPGNSPCHHRAKNPEQTDLTVRNPKSALIHLVAIDHCLYGPADTRRCDCALVRGEEVHFIEFKHGVTKNRSDRLKECIPQLAAAINDFIQAGIIAPQSVVRAVACVGFVSQNPPRGAAVEARVLQLNKLVKEVAVELYVADNTEFS